MTGSMVLFLLKRGATYRFLLRCLAVLEAVSVTVTYQILVSRSTEFAAVSSPPAGATDGVYSVRRSFFFILDLLKHAILRFSHLFLNKVAEIKRET